MTPSHQEASPAGLRKPWKNSLHVLLSADLGPTRGQIHRIIDLDYVRKSADQNTACVLRVRLASESKSLAENRMAFEISLLCQKRLPLGHEHHGLCWAYGSKEKQSFVNSVLMALPLLQLGRCWGTSSRQRFMHCEVGRACQTTCSLRNPCFCRSCGSTGSLLSRLNFSSK